MTWEREEQTGMWSADPEWKVVAEPVGENGTDEKNQSGLRVVLIRGKNQHEVGRVGFRRQNTSQPKMGFDKALQKMLDKAQKSADTMNRLNEEARNAVLEAERRAADLRRQHDDVRETIRSGRSTDLT